MCMRLLESAPFPCDIGGVAKQSSRTHEKKPEMDVNETAARITHAIVSGGKNPAAVVLGRLGGLKGGRARAEKLSPRRRSEIASRAAKAKWARRKTST